MNEAQSILIDLLLDGKITKEDFVVLYDSMFIKNNEFQQYYPRQYPFFTGSPNIYTCPDTSGDVLLGIHSNG